MKSSILLGIITIGLLTSCSSIYKSGQTPDDVYYSPVKGDLKENKKDSYVVQEDDNYLRMKVRNNNRWRQIDDYSYWNDTRFYYSNCNNRFNNGFNNGWNTHFNNNWSNNNFTGFYMNSGFSNFNNFNNCGFNNHFFGNNFWGNNGWNYWNSPVYVFTYKNPSFRGNTAGKNVTAYRNRTYSNTNTSSTGKTGTSNSSSSSFGGLFKRVFTSGNGSSGSSTGSYDRPVRTFGSSSGSSTSSGSSSAGGRSGGFGSSGSSSGSSRQGRN